MAAQYDDIAEQYKKIGGRSHYRLIEYTFLHYLGDISGESVLDLGCGEGCSTRRIKQIGARRVVGVDISEEMLKLAMEQEAKEPLGIEYVLSAAQDLGKIGDFDVVAAVFLLHYAPTNEQLLKMCQTIYDNLKPGKRFITANNDPETKGPEYPPDAYKKYGYRSIQFPQPLQDGSIIKTTLAEDGEEVQFETYYYSKETYEWTLRTAGFKMVSWHGLVLPPEIEQVGGRAFWKLYLEEISPVCIIECQK